MKIQMLQTTFYKGVRYVKGEIYNVAQEVAFAMGSSCKILGGAEQVASKEMGTVSGPSKPQKGKGGKGNKGKGANKMLTTDKTK